MQYSLLPKAGLHSSRRAIGIANTSAKYRNGARWKAKQLSNMRSSGADRKMKVAPAIRMGIEECLEHINHDECVEITPNNIRLRKLLLDENDRKRAYKKALNPDG